MEREEARADKDIRSKTLKAGFTGQTGILQKGGSMKRMILKLTNKQLYDIRKFVEESGYPAHCGKHFWLISPVITEFQEKLDVVVLTEKEGYKVKKVISEMLKKGAI